MFYFLRCGILLSTIVLLLVSRAEAKQPPGYDQIRIGLIPAEVGGYRQEKDQVAFEILPIDGSNYQQYPSTFVTYRFIGKSGAPVDITAPVCAWPLFQVTVDNKSDQTLKLRSAASGSSDEVIIAIDDDKGGNFTAIRKTALKELINDASPSVAQQYAQDPAAAATQMKSQGIALVNSLPMLTENTTILPGRKSIFYTCFEYVPGVATVGALNAWFHQRSELTLGFYDIPVKRDEGGSVQKKTNYQFNLRIKEWRDRYEYEAAGSNWHPKVANSTLVRDAKSGPAKVLSAREEVKTPPLLPASKEENTQTGTLAVISTPPGALIAIDGKDVGRSPALLPDIAAGDHIIQATWSDKKTRTVKQGIQSGKTETVRIDPPNSQN